MRCDMQKRIVFGITLECRIWQLNFICVYRRRKVSLNKKLCVSCMWKFILLCDFLSPWWQVASGWAGCWRHHPLDSPAQLTWINIGRLLRAASLMGLLFYSLQNKAPPFSDCLRFTAAASVEVARRVANFNCNFTFCLKYCCCSFNTLVSLCQLVPLFLFFYLLRPIDRDGGRSRKVVHPRRSDNP